MKRRGELAELFGVARLTIYRTVERMNQPAVDRPGLGLTSAHRTRWVAVRLNKDMWRRSLWAGVSTQFERKVVT